MQPPDPVVGRSIKGYLVTELLGEGGMGCVYKAEHPKIGKKVALKLLRGAFANNPQIMGRFLTEAKAVNDIRHENVVDIIDLDETPEGEPFILMELLEGKTLADAIAEEAPFTPQRAGSIALQVCSALSAAHQHGIVHRDLKGDNIFLIKRGARRDFVKVLDFGIAKLMHGSDFAGNSTTPGAIIGTPMIMSPEQASGEPTDERTDIYALGVLLYQMATGTAPFHSENQIDLLLQQITAPLPPVRSRNAKVSPEWAAVIERCLQKDKEARYGSMRALALALGPVCNLDPVPYLWDTGSSASIRLAPVASTDRVRQAKTEPLIAPTEPRLAPVSPGMEDAPTLNEEEEPLLLAEYMENEAQPHEALRAFPTEALVLSGLPSATERMEHVPGPPPAPQRAPTTSAPIVIPASPPAVRGGFWRIAALSLGAGAAATVLWLVLSSGPKDGGPGPLPVSVLPAVSSSGTQSEPSSASAPATSQATSPPEAPAPAATEEPAPQPPSPPTRNASTLTVRAKPSCEVFLDGKSLGYTPIYKHPARPGAHNLRLRNEKHAINFSTTITVKAGKETKELFEFPSAF